jgi:hypothetical protein
MDGLHYENQTKDRRPVESHALPNDVSAVLRKVLKNNEALISQNAALLSFLSESGAAKISSSEGSTSPHQEHFVPLSKSSTFATLAEQSLQNPDEDKWVNIFTTSAYASSDFTSAYFDWPRPPTLSAVLNERHSWTSWSYKASFPHLARFLHQAIKERKTQRCPCQVVVEDFSTVGGEARTVVLGKTNRKVEDLWKGVRSRAGLTDVSKGLGLGENGTGVSSRLWKVIDLSPVVLACLLGSSPQ